MPATEKNSEARGCYGICCELRGKCALYAAVEHVTEPDTIATCDTGSGKRPLFAARVVAAAEV